MNIKKNVITRVIPVAVMLFLVIAVIAYQRGIYDVSFIERPAKVPDSEDTTYTPPVSDSAPESPETDPPADSAPSDEHYAADSRLDFVSCLYTAEELYTKGYYVSDGEFDSTYVFGILSPAVAPGSEYSLRFRTVQFPERIPEEIYNGYTTVMRGAVMPHPAAEMHMDHLLIDNGETVTVLKNDGSVLVEAFDTAVYVPAYTRDKNDRPLYKAQEKSRYNPKNTITVYYYIDDSGKLVKSDYSDDADGRGLYVNYPASYGKSDGNLFRYYSKNTELYGFGGASGNMRTEYKYLKAFNYSEGLGAAVDADGFMHFLGEHLYAKISGHYQIYKNYNSARRRLLCLYLMPDTFGEESLGFFYFDRGLVRVRCQVVDAYHFIERDKKYTASDTDIIIRSDGTQFPTPSDYRVISYSNGVILLEKDGKYGYMDYTGKWILQPEYTVAKPFYEGLAVVGNEGALGVIDTTGAFVIPTGFDEIESASGGVIACYSNEDGWLLLNKMTYAVAE